MKIIDATGLILGRMTTKVAKLALKGEEVAVVNCEKAIISGKKKTILKKYKERRERGKGPKGPYFPRMPDRIIKRTIKGMLPKKHWSEKSRGRLALARVKCYIGLPDQFKNKKIETLEKASGLQLKINTLSVGELAKLLGAKW